MIMSLLIDQDRVPHLRDPAMMALVLRHPVVLLVLLVALILVLVEVMEADKMIAGGMENATISSTQDQQMWFLNRAKMEHPLNWCQTIID